MTGIPVKVVDHIFIGDRHSAKARGLLKQHNIKFVLNCTPDRNTDPVAGCPNFFEKEGKIKYRRVAVFDNRGEDLRPHFEPSVAFIEQAKFYGSVLVHCNQGRSRSGSMILAYMMKVHGLTYDEALAQARTRRPEIDPNDAFETQLRAFDEQMAAARAKKQAEDGSSGGSGGGSSGIRGSGRKRPRGPAIGPARAPAAGPARGPAAGPAVGPAIGPARGPAGPAVGPAAGPAIGSVRGAAAGLAAGPAVGPAVDPARGPAVGPEGPPTAPNAAAAETAPAIGPSAPPRSVGPAGPPSRLSPSAEPNGGSASARPEISTSTSKSSGQETDGAAEAATAIGPIGPPTRPSKKRPPDADAAAEGGAATAEPCAGASAEHDAKKLRTGTSTEE